MLPYARHGNSSDGLRSVARFDSDTIGYHRLDTRLPGASGQLGLQRLIADIAARLVAVEPEAIDDSVRGGLLQVVDALRLDHAILWRPNGEALSVVASHVGRQAPRFVPEPALIASIPSIASMMRQGDATWFTRLDEIPDPMDRAAALRQGLRSAAVVPIALTAGNSEVRAALAFISRTTEQEWPPAVIEQLRLVAGIFGLALARKANQKTLQIALDEPRRREYGIDEGEHSRHDVKASRISRLIVSESPAIRHALAQTELVASTTATVLLLGETGAGKEVFARAIHELSSRRESPMIYVNCAAIPSALIESELFGRERGAYTGAVTRQIGRFEAAHGSTIFLDEIGELPLDVQAKLLRVLQDRVVERLGSTQAIKVDVRIIAATNRNLEKAVDDKAFRADLFYRLNVFPITVPPLRERVEDIPTLVWEFIDEFSKSCGKSIESISKESMRELERYSWRGNVRELRNVIERAVIVATGPRLKVPLPQSPRPLQPPAVTSLATLQLEHIRATLELSKWRIRGAGGAAERLGLKPTTLESRIAKMGLVKPGAIG